MKIQFVSIVKLAILAVLSFAMSVGDFSASSAQDTDSELPTEYSRGSSYIIRYDDWDLILSSAVLETGLSDRRPASRTDKRNVTTRIRHTNMRSTSFEGNRVNFDLFSDKHVDSLRAIRKDLEAVPTFVPLEQFSKNEQLAYWLNLHNVAVLYEIAQAYPIKKIKPLMRGRNSVWGKKTMSVAGIPVSIRDIEEHIVTNWNDPLVLYGIFMGTVGSPNIRAGAYTGENVIEALKENATDFVNSLRGFRLWSGYGRVSDHYELGEHYFPEFNKDMKRHLMQFASIDTERALVKADTFRIKNYDWHIADLKDGSVYSGSSFNTNPGALAWFIQSMPNAAGDAAGTTPAGAAMFDNFVGDPVFNQGSGGKLSPQTRAFLRAMKKRNELRHREGEVTVEEFVSEDGGRITTRDAQESAKEDDISDPDDGGVIIAE